MKILFNISVILLTCSVLAQNNDEFIYPSDIPESFRLTLVSKSYTDTSFTNPYIKGYSFRHWSKVKIRNKSGYYSKLVFKTNYNMDRIRVKYKNEDQVSGKKIKYLIQSGRLNKYKARASSDDDFKNVNLFGSNLSKVKIKFNRVESRYLGNLKVTGVVGTSKEKNKQKLTFNVNLLSITDISLVREDVKVLVPYLN